MTRSFKPGDFVIHRDRDVVGHVWMCKTDLASVRYLSVYDRRSDEFDYPYTAPETEWWHYDEDELARPIRRFLAGVAVCAAMQLGLDRVVAELALATYVRDPTHAHLFTAAHALTLESTMPPERWQSIKDELTRLSTQKEQP